MIKLYKRKIDGATAFYISYKLENRICRWVIIVMDSCLLSIQLVFDMLLPFCKFFVRIIISLVKTTGIGRSRKVIKSQSMAVHLISHMISNMIFVIRIKIFHFYLFVTLNWLTKILQTQHDISWIYLYYQPINF